MTPRAKFLLIASAFAIPCLAYTAPCFGHNGRDDDAPTATADTYNAADALSCIDVTTDARTGVRTYTQTCDIPHEPVRPGAVAANVPMEHGVDFWVGQSFAGGNGVNYAPVPPGYEHSSYSNGYSNEGYSDSYVSDGYYGYGYGGYGGYLPGAGYGDGSGRPGRGHGGNGGHGDHGGGGGRPGRPGHGDNAPPTSGGGNHPQPRRQFNVPLPRGVGSPPPYYDPGVGAPPPDFRYNTRGGRRG